MTNEATEEVRSTRESTNSGSTSTCFRCWQHPRIGRATGLHSNRTQAQTFLDAANALDKQPEVEVGETELTSVPATLSIAPSSITWFISFARLHIAVVPHGYL